jgi:hypothetical protein
LPVEGQILYANAVPMIGELHASGVNHSLDLVRNDEFEVLCPIFIADEKTIFYLDHSYKVFFFLLLKIKLFKI